MTYAHQPGSLPIDVPETEPNPVFVPEDPPHVPAPVPSDPVETPERVPEKVSGCPPSAPLGQVVGFHVGRISGSS
jgi:hypothetical protein